MIDLALAVQPKTVTIIFKGFEDSPLQHFNVNRVTEGDFLRVETDGGVYCYRMSTIDGYSVVKDTQETHKED